MWEGIQVPSLLMWEGGFSFPQNTMLCMWEEILHQAIEGEHSEQEAEAPQVPAGLCSDQQICYWKVIAAKDYNI